MPLCPGDTTVLARPIIRKLNLPEVKFSIRSVPTAADYVTDAGSCLRRLFSDVLQLCSRSAGGDNRRGLARDTPEAIALPHRVPTNLPR